MVNNTISALFDFIQQSPTAFHATAQVAKLLTEQGFTQLSERNVWQITAGGRYFVTKNGSALIAFSIPATVHTEHAHDPCGFMMTASHSDSPMFKIKENPELTRAGAVVLNVEKYGGLLLQPWFDRPLSIAGRIVVRNHAGGTETRLVNLNRDLLVIPNLAIHMNREANDGHKIDVQQEMQPVFSLSSEVTLMALVAKEAAVSESDILSADLFVYNRTAPSMWGAEKEFISSPRLDDLACAWTTVQGFISAITDADTCEKPLSMIPVYCLFDNEEVGSSSRQGADSTFLSDVLERISEKLGWKGELHKIALSKSLMVSADNAHAVHPNYAASADPVNQPHINGGIVIKYNAAQKYTTDAETSAFFKLVCEKASVPYQVFTNNANIAGGSTLGNISQNHVSVPCVDIGLAQWAMHSPYETAGAQDIDYAVQVIRTLYASVY